MISGDNMRKRHKWLEDKDSKDSIDISILFEGMDKETSLKIASIAFLTHSLMEILGTLITPPSNDPQ